MTRPVILQPDAEEDVRSIFAFLESQRPKHGSVFTSRLRFVLGQIERMPTLFGVVWRDVRAVRVRTFRYVVYYVVSATRIDVIAVMHAALHASAWKARR